MQYLKRISRQLKRKSPPKNKIRKLIRFLEPLYRERYAKTPAQAVLGLGRLNSYESLTIKSIPLRFDNLLL
jgi:hypothetical protein